jgi:hypothetical protein
MPFAHSMPMPISAFSAYSSAFGSLICPLGRRTGVPLGTSDDARPW